MKPETPLYHIADHPWIFGISALFLFLLIFVPFILAANSGELDDPFDIDDFYD